MSPYLVWLLLRGTSENQQRWSKQRSTTPYIGWECEWKELQQMSSCYSCQPHSQQCFPTPSSDLPGPALSRWAPGTAHGRGTEGTAWIPPCSSQAKLSSALSPPGQWKPPLLTVLTAAVQLHNSITAPCPKLHKGLGYATPSTPCVLIWKQVSSLELWVLFWGPDVICFALFAMLSTLLSPELLSSMQIGKLW